MKPKFHGILLCVILIKKNSTLAVYKISKYFKKYKRKHISNQINAEMNYSLISFFLRLTAVELVKEKLSPKKFNSIKKQRRQESRSSRWRQSEGSQNKPKIFTFLRVYCCALWQYMQVYLRSIIISEYVSTSLCLFECLS